MYTYVHRSVQIRYNERFINGDNTRSRLRLSPKLTPTIFKLSDLTSHFELATANLCIEYERSCQKMQPQ